MSCRITLEGVFAENGQPSQLYKELLDTVGDENEAQSLYAVTETQGFIDSVLNPMKGISKAFDSNGEIKPKYVIQYVTELNKTVSKMSIEDVIDVQSVLATNPFIKDSKQLHNILEKAFYDENGLFNPSVKSLTDSGLYSVYEANKITNDIRLQENIKNNMEKINNSPIVENSFEGTPTEYADKQGSINNIGKLSTKNPYEEKNNIVQQYGGLEDIEDEVDNIENTSLQKEFQNPSAKSSFVNEMKSYKRLPNIIEEDGQLVPYVEKSIKTNAIKLTNNSKLIADLEVLKTIDESLLESEEALQYVKKLEKDLAGIGIDVIGLSALPGYITIIEPLQNFLFNPNKANTKTLEDMYNDMFSVDTESKPKVVATESEQSLHYIETDLSEGEMFDRGYIKTGTPNIYQKVQKVDTDTLRQLMGKSMSQKEINSLLDTESLKLKKINDNEKAKEIVAYKTIFGHPVTTQATGEVLSETEDRAVTFNGNQEYLTGDFIADFNAQMLKEKQKGSSKYETFYSKFGINEKGIYLKSTDPLTVANIKAWLQSGEIVDAENIVNYSLLSKSMPVLGEITKTEYPTKETKRVAYVNNPNAAPLITTPYTNMNHTFITVENATSDFIRTPNGTYEMIETKGNTSIYAIIPSNEDNNYFDLSPKQSFASEDLSWIEKFKEGGQVKDSFVKEKSLLSKEERQRISEENFDCI